MVVKNFILTTSTISIYLFTLMGVGRYSCHCDHASQLSFFGIRTQCSCTHEVESSHKGHKCICGEHLLAKEPKKDDCCSVSYYFLDSDQDSQDNSFDFILTDISLLLPQNMLCLGIAIIQRPIIKTFHALFRCAPIPIFELNRQLIL